VTLSVLLAVTHLLGVGHLTRAAALGRGLAAAGHRVTLVSGGRAAPLVPTTGIAFVQLPPVHCRDLDFSTLLGDDGEPIGDEVRDARVELLLATLSRTDPDIVITETFPFGRRQLAAEFGALVEAAARRTPRPAILASIRDILNPPSRPSRAMEAEETLGRFYDGVLVHGDAAVAPLAASWPVGAALERRLTYTGYIVEDAATTPPPPKPDEDEVLVSGGGSAASLPVFRAAIGAARLMPGEMRWRLLVGHSVPASDFEALRAQAGERLVVERARSDFTSLLARCAVSVSQAGYNTVIDLVQARSRAVLVPFERGNEAEQRLRAGRFAALGVAEIVPEASVTAGRLADAVTAALARPKPERIAIDLGGIRGSIEAVAVQARRRAAIGAAWARLEAALRRAAADRRDVAMWWRDDDAIAPSRALDRLLELARQHDVPVALAVVPDLAEPSLAARLAEEPLASVLVHGCRHENHAPPGAKRQELGYRSSSDIESGLAASRQRIERLFGAQAVPILVPPWNRIDPTLVPRLPALGFTGLSTFGPAGHGAPAAIRTINAHVDPIDWKEGRGLAEEAGLLDRLCAAIDLADRAGGSSEPIGILTHHLVHDPWIWAFVDDLLGRLRACSAVRFADARSI
jgi:predicted glycosyltransferase/peptidoglycan/xylan/chitin deacetylase (PgdA/CDA1 family)